MIEDNIKRIADASEIIAAKLSELCNKLDHIGCALPVLNEQVTTTKVQTVPVAEAPPAPEVKAAPVAPPAPEVKAAPVAPAPVQPAPTPVAPVAMTAEELNAALVKEYQRLKSRDPIIAAMSEMGATAISELKPEQYADLLAKVRAA